MPHECAKWRKTVHYGRMAGVREIRQAIGRVVTTRSAAVIEPMLVDIMIEVRSTPESSRDRSVPPFSRFE